MIQKTTTTFCRFVLIVLVIVLFLAIFFTSIRLAKNSKILFFTSPSVLLALFKNLLFRWIFFFFSLFFLLPRRSRHPVPQEVCSAYWSRSNTFLVCYQLLFFLSRTPWWDKVDREKKGRWYSSFHWSTFN
jgi:hypothetical protein